MKKKYYTIHYINGEKEIVLKELDTYEIKILKNIFKIKKIFEVRNNKNEVVINKYNLKK